MEQKPTTPETPKEEAKTTPTLTPIQVVVETEEQKVLRANACMAELDAILKKYNCEYAFELTMNSHTGNTFKVKVETK